MGLRISLLALSLACLSVAANLPLANVSDPGPLKQHGMKGSGVVQHVIKHKRRKDLTKRQDPSILYNINIAYVIEISVGTPQQTIDVVLDTGSSELWVDPTCANSYNPALCDTLPRYDPNNSSTAVDEGQPFSIQYGTGATSGEYLLDTVNIAGVDLIQQQFGWASTSSFSIVGLIGVGLGYGFGPAGYFTYYNPIDQLFVQGYTHSRAFGLDLGSSALSQGTIAFGGIDTAKYIGALEVRPMIPYYNSPDQTPRYWFYMTSVGVTQPGSNSSFVLTTPNYNQAMFPDCGATLSQLPPNLFTALISYFPTAVNNGNGVYTIDCSIRSQPGSIDFGFGGTIIKVTYFEWFRQVGTTCYFGGVSNADTWSLGDSFMRSAYIVYDQDNFNIHIAQGANCGSNLVAIGSGVNAVPSLVGQCTAVSSTSSAVSSSGTSSKSSSSTAKGTTSSSSSNASTTSSVSSTKTTSKSSSQVSSTSSSSSSSVSKTSNSLSTSKSTSSLTSTTSSTLPTSTLTTSKSTSSSKSSTLSTSTSSKPLSSSSSSSSASASSKSITLSTSTKSTTTSQPTSSPSSPTSSTLSTSTSLKSTSTSSSKSTSTASSSNTSTSPTSTIQVLSSTSTSTKSSSKGPTTTFVSSYTTSHHRIVTTIIQK